MFARFTLHFAVACVFFGCSDPPDPVAELVRARDFGALVLLGEDPDEKLACRATRAVVWARGPEVVAPHLALLKHTRCGWDIRAEAAWALAEEATGGERNIALTAMTPLLADPDEKIRWNGARTIGLLGLPEGVPVVEKCLVDANKFVAAWCAWAKCKLGPGKGCAKPNMDLTNGKPAP